MFRGCQENKILVQLVNKGKESSICFPFPWQGLCLSVTEIIDENRFYFFDFQLTDENMINLKYHCFVSPNKRINLNNDQQNLVS